MENFLRVEVVEGCAVGAFGDVFSRVIFIIVVIIVIVIASVVVIVGVVVVVIVVIVITFAISHEMCRVKIMNTQLLRYIGDSVLDFGFDGVGDVVEEIDQGVRGRFSGVEDVLAEAGRVELLKRRGF